MLTFWELDMPMENMTLADGGFGEIINIVIILLVVGGSVFGALAKKLIGVFSPKEADELGETPGSSTDAQKPLVAARQSARPTQPSAGPPRPASPSHPAAAPAMPWRGTPPPVVVEMVSGEEPAPPHSPWSSEPKRTARPVSAPQDIPEQRPPTPREPAAARAAERLGHLEVSVFDEETRFESGGPEEEEGFDAVVERGLGHAEPAPGEASGAFEVRCHSLLVSQPSRQMLRRAVVLREILSPPLALRPPDDQL